jgi:TRAP-type C4-dicarboxylate transport system permease small subunit
VTASGRLGRIVLLVPKIVVTGLLVLAIADMIAGVFLRYVMVEITDRLDLEPVNFFWVEEVGEFTLAWLTLIGAGIGIAERTHFTLRFLSHRLPLPAQRVIHIVNHLLIAGFGALAAWYGMRLVVNNLQLTSPGLQINLAWLYAATVAGGVLILIYGIGVGLCSPAVPEDEIDAGAARAATGD